MPSFALEDFRWLVLLLLIPAFAWVSVRFATPLGPFRRWTAVVLRSAGLLCLVLALAGFTLLKQHDELGVLFLVDASDSVPPAGKSHALAFAREASKHMRANDRAGIVVFGRDAMVENAPKETLEVGEKIQSVIDPTASDLAAAMRVASGVFPSDAKKRVILLSDGLQTRGSLDEEAVAAASQGIQVDYLALSRGEGAEVLVERVQTPSRVAEGEAFDVRAVLRPFDDGPATVRLFRDGALVSEREVSLTAGEARVVTFPQKLEEGGFFSYEVVIEPKKDTIAQNNAATGYVRVAGTPKVMIASDAKGKGRHLAAALESGGFDVRVAGIDALGTTLADLAAYDAVILENVPATSLSRAQMETLRSYARDFGGGLIAVGGDQSYGVGGWKDTPLEEAMPVTMTLKETEQHPSVCMIIVIDKSGSMEGVDPSGVSKIQMAKEAAIGAVELLSDRDSVGVIAFDSASQIMLRPTKLSGGNKHRVIEAIGAIGGGGGTDFFPALHDAVDEANNSGAAVKHVMLLSDGQSSPGDIAGVTAKYANSRISLSAIAIGPDADQHTMEDLAKRGGGRYYFSPDAESIPRIFSRETILVARNYIIEDPFVPQLQAGGGMMRGFETIELPQINGYVGTTKKDQATLWMTSDKGDPLLASWRIGLGKAVAWTSDAEPRWAKHWTDWEGYAKFWTQVVRGSLGARESKGLTATAAIDSDGVLKIEAEATDSAGGFANFKDMRAEVVGPDRKHQQIALRQTGPGRYAGVTRADKVGAYLVTVAMSGGDEVAARAIAGASVSYSPEYKISAGDGGLLARVAQRTGGIALAGADAPALVFRPPEIPARVPRPVTRELLWIAAILFLLDVAIRRVIIGRESFDRVFAFAKGFGAGSPVPATHIGGLAAAKKQAKRQTDAPSPAAEPQPGSWIPQRPTSTSSAPPPPERPVIKPSAPPRTNPDAPASPSGSAGGGNLAGSLLDRVKKKK